MPKFRYVAKKSPTEVVEETLEAESREAVLKSLTDLGYTPLKVFEETSSPGKKKPSSVSLDKKYLSVPCRFL